MPPSHPHFTVDTHIFRELGELLVGRDSTALLELIKNAYDADASEIVVTGTELDHSSRGRIIIQDNGCGMAAAQFENGFLRIASRYKEEGERRSGHFRRRYTGSKGIGRLAAHKLARLMEVSSVSGTPGQPSREAISACIDWQRIEEQETLSNLTNEITLEELSRPRPSMPGTTINLSRLRRLWTPAERTRFIAEARSCQAPTATTAPLPRRVLERTLLFKTPTQRDVLGSDPGCAIRLEGDFAEGDDYWDALIDATNWVLEVEALRGEPEVRFGIAPTKATREDFPEAQRHEFSHPHPAPADGPFFQARILVRDEQIRESRALATWAKQASGIRVYLEGFRILPYGEPGDDWLRVDASYVRRSWDTVEGFDQLCDWDDDLDWQLFALPNASYTGAVFLTQANSSTLQMLVNREGFATDRAFDVLVTILRLGIDLLTRTRAAGKTPELQRRREARERADHIVEPVGSPQEEEPTIPHSGPQPSPHSTPNLTRATAHAVAAVEEAKRALSQGADPQIMQQHLDRTQNAIAGIVSAVDRSRDASAMFRVLASVGTQMASFVHEIRGLLGTAIAVHEAVGRLREDSRILGPSRQRLTEIYTNLGDLRRQIERQATYLVDVASPDAVRRRSRQKIAERFDAAARLIGPSLERRNITLLNEIPSSVKSPPMFSAELTTVFSNLLTNAVKAAGEGGTIRARVSATGAVVVENTGRQVNLEEAERWFLPFESTTTEVDSSLGQGMGLGLTITRDMLEQYGATICFVPPDAGYSTAIEIKFPE